MRALILDAYACFRLGFPFICNFVLTSMEHHFGLIGMPLQHSFSKTYFTEKFKREGIAHTVYTNFELPSIQEFPALLQAHPLLKGLNVTIPYKEAVIPFLDELDEVARKVGAVNTVRLEMEDGEWKMENGRWRLKGYNTDVIGFRDSLLPLLGEERPRALVFGTGGASKAVQYVLGELGIGFDLVGRKSGANSIGFGDIDRKLIGEHLLLINTTPVGTFPLIEECLPIPYDLLWDKHIVYDLVYNPAESLFLQKAKAQGARIKNGLEMLELQAEAAWRIWNGH